MPQEYNDINLDSIMDSGDPTNGMSKAERKAWNKASPGKAYRRGHRAVHLTKFAAIVGVTAVAVGTMVVPPALATSAAAYSAVDYWNSLPAQLTQDSTPLPQRTILLDKNGAQFAQFYSENRQNIPLANVSQLFKDALISTEDAHFYTNHGIDLMGTARVALKNVISNSGQSGASGITQQLVKNLLLLNSTNKEAQAAAADRTLNTKVQELKYAVGLENKYSKDQILEMYINTVYFGNGAYGISAAAKTYFNTTADKLTLEQAATLAGVINNPTIYDPITQPQGAKLRRDMVLGRLLATQKIPQETYDASIKTVTPVTRGQFENGCAQSSYPFYCEMVKQEILTNIAFGDTPEIRQNFLYNGGVTITTALDPKAMDDAQKEVDAAWGPDNRVGTGVAVVVPGTGQISAIAENRKFGNGPGETEVIYPMTKHQVGSSFKPFTLATALEQGIPTSTRMPSPGVYQPAAPWASPPGGFSNFGFIDWGVVDAYKATAESMNTWYVELMQRTGVLPVADMAKRLGINSLPRDGANAITPNSLSLTLGAYEITPLEMANAYATFASGGVGCNAVSIIGAVRTDTKAKVPVSDPDCHQAIMPNIANTVSDVLKGITAKGGSAEGRGLSDRPYAAKTGTTNDWADAWMLGYTPQFATAVWTGDPRGGNAYPLNTYVQYGAFKNGPFDGDGAYASGPILQAIMTDLHSGLPVKDFAPISKSVGTAITAQSVPDVRGLKVDEAVSVLLANDYVPKIATATAPATGPVDKNVVVSQSPAGGSNGSHKQEVTLTLSEGSDTAIQLPTKKG
jgi:membrane peptidoglycan carboxypeptidase